MRGRAIGFLFSLAFASATPALAAQTPLPTPPLPPASAPISCKQATLDLVIRYAPYSALVDAISAHCKIGDAIVVPSTMVVFCNPELPIYAGVSAAICYLDSQRAVVNRLHRIESLRENGSQ